MVKRNFDIVIVGGGMVGLSIAFQLLERKLVKKIAVLEKENSLGMHSSGRNSGILHSGLYYKPNTLKSKVCISGARRLKNWISQNDIPINNCGKVIIPQRIELDKELDVIESRGKKNGAVVEMLDEKELSKLAPMAKSASGRALWSPNTSVVSPLKIINKLKNQLVEKGVVFYMSEINWSQKDSQQKITLTNGELINYSWLINSSGLHADKIAHKFNVGLDYSLMPFKGIYWQIKKTSPIKINTNIYPVPDLNLPFLGIHFTPNAESLPLVTIGPTATPTFGRENYKRLENVEPLFFLGNFKEILYQYFLNTGGFRKYAGEQMLLSFPSLFLKAARELIPSLKIDDIEISKKVGIRAQLFNRKNKCLEQDFLCINGENSTHVLNAISPAFTASFALADLIIDQYLLKGLSK